MQIPGLKARSGEYQYAGDAKEREGKEMSEVNGRYVMDKQRCAFVETTHALRGPYHT